MNDDEMKRAQELFRAKPARPIIGNDHDFFVELLKMHPEADKKIGCGIERFEVRQTEFGWKSMFVVRNDGTAVDFSYRRCFGLSPNRSINKLRALQRIADDAEA